MGVGNRQAWFISLHDILTRIKTKYDIPYQAAAEELFKSTSESYYKGRIPRFYAYYEGEDEPRLADRRQAFRPLANAAVEVHEQTVLDLKRYGCMIAEIIPLLLLGNPEIDIREIPEEHEPMASNLFPPWKQSLVLLPYLTDSDAAHVLAGVEPSPAGEGLNVTGADVERDEINHYHTLISKAIEAGEIPAEVKTKKLSKTIWNIRPVDLIAWSEMKGFPSPLPKSPLAGAFSPATNTGLRETPVNQKQELEQLKARVKELEAAEDQRAELQAEVKRLSGELRDKEREIEKLTTERDRLKADQLKGLQKSAALNIIGGMAMDSYRMDINADPLEEIGEMVKDFQLKGANVTEKTLSKFIKAAAKEIAKNAEDPT